MDHGSCIGQFRFTVVDTGIDDTVQSQKTEVTHGTKRSRDFSVTSDFQPINV